MSTYKGDSPGKKVSRLRTWITLLRIGRVLRLPYMGSLVLAGEGGDLATLGGLGVPMDTVTAVDLDSDWLEYCSEVYPKVRTIHGEVGAVSRGVPFNLAHIDFCGGLCAANIKTVADVVRNVNSHPAVIAVTMLKGREFKGAHKSTITAGISRSARRRVLQVARKAKSLTGEHLLSGGVFDPRLVLSFAEKRLRRTPAEGHTYQDIILPKGKISPLGAGMMRASAMQECVEWLLAAQEEQSPGEIRLSIRIAAVLGYHSKSKHTNGTPFATAIYIVHRIPQGRDIMALMLQQPGALAFDSMNMDRSRSILPPTAAELARLVPVEDVARMLDVAPSTVVAWKAHATRGTYTTEPLLRVQRGVQEGFTLGPVAEGRML